MTNIGRGNNGNMMVIIAYRLMVEMTLSQVAGDVHDKTDGANGWGSDRGH